MKKLILLIVVSVIVGFVVNVGAETRLLKMRELYNKDLSYSDLAKSLKDRYITVSGYMAPPLKAESNFFVLTKQPLSVCPFCETEAEWPDDILGIYTKRLIKLVPFNVDINVTGILKLGNYIDVDTGFLSRVRITNAIYSVQ